MTPTLAVGTVVDGYRVTRLVAEGAMGEVYLAVDEQLGRRLALKFPRAAGLEAWALQRFAAEARTTAQFSHPHIVTLYGAGVHAGRPYLALEYLDGETLRARLEARGRFPLREALRVARAVADALAEAHARGVIHADLKPENVLVPRDGRARVVDFGLARLAGAEGVAASGTPSYMAPERWKGAPPDASIDVWALGVMLHELLDGARPWTDAALARLAYSPQPLTLGPVTAGGPCAALVRACLELEPGKRLTAAQALAQVDALLVGADVREERSPFRGLAAFSEADAADYCGREAEVDLALERLRTDGLVPVVGPSGVGKSSFVFAGVVPRLRESGAWDVVALRPGRRPLASLATALGCPLEALSQRPAGLVAALRERAREGRRTLLVIDQFEELVTLGDERERAQTLAALQLAASADEPWRVLITLRSDFLGAFAALPGLDAALSSVLVLRALSRAGLVAAIATPLRRVGYAPDHPALPERIAVELEGEAAALPLLQFVCQALWERRDAQRRVLSSWEYEALAGATGALATHAQRLVAGFPTAERELTRELMLRLVGIDGTRRPRGRVELLEGLPAGASAVLDALLSQCLLVSGQDDASGQPMVELAHESLVATWPQLTRWLAESQEARSAAHELEQAAQAWVKGGRSGDDTWTGATLADATRRVERWHVSLSADAHAFLAAGQAHEARAARRQRTRLALTIGGLVVLLVAASGAALVARERERAALAQQEEVRLAAGDVGRFTLVLEPFDWEPGAQAVTPVPADALPGLDWALHELPVDTDEPAGARLGGALRPVRGARPVGPEWSEVVEARGGPAVFEIFGRGRPGEVCGSSWVRVRALPAYGARGQAHRIVLQVPTCRASRAGLAPIPADPGGSLAAFSIDPRGVPAPLAARYFEGQAALTGDRSEAGSAGHGGRERLCWFLGRRVPSPAECQRAALVLDGPGGQPPGGARCALTDE